MVKRKSKYRDRIVFGSLFFFCTLLFFSTRCLSENNQGLLTYRLKWLFNVSAAGDLYADANGIFSAYGLEVVVKAGGPERDAIKELELGYADFGVASADQVIRALSKKSPVVVLAQLFQVNPLQWVYRHTLGDIEGLQDLKGKTIGITYGGNDETIMRALLSAGGLSERDVTYFSVRYDYTPFYKGRVDIWPVYQNAQGVIIEDKLHAAGEKVCFLDPSRFGVQFVANSVITSSRALEETPQVVARFLAALLEGWRQAMAPAHEQQTLQTLRRFDEDTPASILEKQLTATRRLVKPSASVAIGTINVDAWRQTEQIMLSQKLIPAPVNIEEALWLNIHLNPVID